MRARSRVFGVLAAGALSAACRESYRVGEHVWVAWDGRDYPAFVVERKSATRFRVHYDGYDARWDEEVTIERIKGKVEGPVAAPPPPERVARAMGLVPRASDSAGAPSAFRPGQRLRVRWRGSVYAATVTSVPAAGGLLVHYDGYGPEWDEVIAEDRVVGRR